MARFGQILIDGVAVILVGVGLFAAVAGYVRNVPDPAPRVAESPAVWEEPVTTGSIAPVPDLPDLGAADGPAEGAAGPRAWIDPPLRQRRAPGRSHG